MFSGTRCGTRQTAGQRQLGAVVFLAGAFAAFLAVSEQLPLSAADFFFFFSSPSLLSTASLKLPASNRSLTARGAEACCTNKPHREPLPACLAGHG